MSEELAVSNQTLWATMDDLLAYMESLTLLECEREGTLPEERGEIERQIGEVKAKIEELNQKVADKTDACAAVLRRLGNEQEFLHKERDRLKAKEQACERAERQLREYVMAVMRKQNVTRLKTQTNTLFLRNTEAVEVTDVDALDPQFQYAEMKMPYSLWLAIMQIIQRDAPQPVASDAALVRVKAEPALSVIKKAIKSGVDVDGADLQMNEHLVCR